MDPISDMLTAIRNALIVKHATVRVPFSNLKYGIVKILEKEGFIEKVEKKRKRSKRFIEITLKYTDNLPAISGLKRISKLGQRIYSSRRKIKRVKSGYGMAIISTSKGLMTDKEARKQKLGGEIICEV
ncbi:MAG: 30S ribosomal protein S8, partial [Patescibacteria group bacterium]|nr:30S ribosomal protein S8 [Patescibacteria group bacterium]